MRSGLYLITPDDVHADALLARVQPVLPFAAYLQYRNKRADDDLRRMPATLVSSPT